jgi:hypothetical protein
MNNVEGRPVHIGDLGGRLWREVSEARSDFDSVSKMSLKLKRK